MTCFKPTIPIQCLNITNIADSCLPEIRKNFIIPNESRPLSVDQCIMHALCRMSWSPQYTVGRLNFLGSMLRRIKNAAAQKKLVDIETQARIFPALLRCSIKILVALKRDRYKLRRRGRRFS